MKGHDFDFQHSCVFELWLLLSPYSVGQTAAGFPACWSHELC